MQSRLSQIYGKSSTTATAPIMWSQAGQDFQRWAEPQITDRSQSALCGRLVTAINNCEMSLEAAQLKFSNAINDALWAGN